MTKGRNLYNICILKIQHFFPDYVISILKSIFETVSTKNIILVQEWKNLTNCAKEINIDFITLKGQALYNRLYKINGLRTFDDIDILLMNNNECKFIDDIFKKNGYVQGEVIENDFGDYTIKKLSMQRLNGYATELQHFGEYVKLTDNCNFPYVSFDVHYRLTTDFDDYEFDMNDVKNNIIEIDGNFYMSNEYQLLHLFTHLYWHTRSIREFIAHRDNNLKDYLDIYELLENFDINISEIKRIINIQESLKLPVSYSLVNVWRLYKSEKAYMILENLDVSQEIKKEILGIGDRWILKNNKNFAYWNENIEKLAFDYDKKKYALQMLYKNFLDSDLLNV